MVALFVLVLLILIIITTYYSYQNFINTHFRKDGAMIYDYFMNHCLKAVSNNNFMNYGLWDDENNTLEKANINLCEFVYSKIPAKHTTHTKRRILDVGCGYGCQDILWTNKIKDENGNGNDDININTKIYAIDISEKQIKHAIALQKENNISNKRLSYSVGNALTVKDQFKYKFDAILSLESAFHYNKRPLFFRNVHDLLKDDGVFVITDIILNNNDPSIVGSIFMKFAIDFFNIPQENLVRLDGWKKSVKDSGLEFIEMYDITEKTFDPYYRYFFNTYYKNTPILSTICRNVMGYVQPFSYVVAVCKKKQ